MCGSLCDAVLADPAASGQETLEHLEHANLFVVPLDNERRWYRYHHLFADLLRQRLQQSGVDEAQSAPTRQRSGMKENGLEIEAFQHAAAANDIERAARLLEGRRACRCTPRGGVPPTLKWLEFAAQRPCWMQDRALWVMWASALLVGRTNDRRRREIAEGRNSPAARRARTTRPATCMGRSRPPGPWWRSVTTTPRRSSQQASRALEYLQPDNLSFRIQGPCGAGQRPRASAGTMRRSDEPMRKRCPSRRRPGTSSTSASTTIGLGQAQEFANQLHPAAESYRRAMRLLGDQPPPILSYAYLGLARILCEWNDLAAAEQHLQSWACNWRDSTTGTSMCSLSVRCCLPASACPGRCDGGGSPVGEGRADCAPDATSRCAWPGDRCGPGADAASPGQSGRSRRRWPRHTNSQ